MKANGTVFKYGDNVDTDVIIPARYLNIADRQELARLLNIADTQIGYITNVDVGEGLLKIGSSLVPFVNRYPKDTKLYRLMTTKLSEQSQLSSDPADLDQRELNILAKIREVARTQE